MSIITLKNINKLYVGKSFKFSALKNINLNIKKGEMIAIMGPSGAGKSTLLNIIGCMDVASSGEYYLENKLIKNLSQREIAHIRNKYIGFVFQHFGLINDYNVIENIELPLTYRKMTNKDRRKISCFYLEKLGISVQEKKFPNQLSGGERQRVAIARALVSNPSLILADEPTGSLDEETGNNIMGLLKEVHNEGKTVIIVTHNKDIAEQCEKTIYIKNGEIQNQLIAK